MILTALCALTICLGQTGKSKPSQTEIGENRVVKYAKPPDDFTPTITYDVFESDWNIRLGPFAVKAKDAAGAAIDLKVTLLAIIKDNGDIRNGKLMRRKDGRGKSLPPRMPPARTYLMVTHEAAAETGRKTKFAISQNAKMIWFNGEGKIPLGNASLAKTSGGAARAKAVIVGAPVPHIGFLLGPGKPSLRVGDIEFRFTDEEVKQIHGLAAWLRKPSLAALCEVKDEASGKAAKPENSK